MITINKRMRWGITAAVLLLIVLWITMSQERKPNPVKPGKTAPMPDDNRGHGKFHPNLQWT
jgi:hypothetical protein